MVIAVSDAGSWKVFIKPVKALMIYMCQGSNKSLVIKIKIIIVNMAARLSHISIVFFFFHLSDNAPANIETNTYGAYELINKNADCNAEPVFSYNHILKAKEVIELPSCDKL